MKKTLILGGPGTGKTGTLLNVVDRLLERKVAPERIAFVSFTQRAVEEARSRAMTRFDMPAKRFPHFRTLHSSCFRALGLTRDNVLTERRLAEFRKKLGLRPSRPDENGDPYAFLDGLARTTMTPLHHAWESRGGLGVAWHDLKFYADSLARYKRDNAMVDFTDMLAAYCEDGPLPTPVDYAIIDEAQDLSRLQWRVVEKSFARCSHIWYAGDDDQAIYEWSGADVETFRGIPVDKRIILDQSRRLPQTILDYSRKMIATVEDRYEKEFSSTRRKGEVRFLPSPAAIDLTSGTWLMLARCACFLNEYVETCENQGVVYRVHGAHASGNERLGVNPEDVAAAHAYEKMRRGITVSDDERALVNARVIDHGQKIDARSPIWHEAFRMLSPTTLAYYANVLRNGFKLDAKPTVTISTIHAIKGGEADHVFLAPDVTRAVANETRVDADAETRVWYVAATRARSTLTIGDPRGTIDAWPFLRSFARD